MSKKKKKKTPKHIHKQILPKAPYNFVKIGKGVEYRHLESLLLTMLPHL
jgi:hypothetical protein